jgi:hypothetical protein
MIVRRGSTWSERASSGGWSTTGIAWRLSWPSARRLELLFLRNGHLLKSLWLAAGKGLDAIEEALSLRTVLKATGWTDSVH